MELMLRRQHTVTTNLADMKSPGVTTNHVIKFILYTHIYIKLIENLHNFVKKN